MRDALDEQYYAQLKHRLTKYRNIKSQRILDHLNNRWCPLDVMAKKQICDAYYPKWDEPNGVRQALGGWAGSAGAIGHYHTGRRQATILTRKNVCER